MESFKRMAVAHTIIFSIASAVFVSYGVNLIYCYKGCGLEGIGVALVSMFWAFVSLVAGFVLYYRMFKSKNFWNKSFAVPLVVLVYILLVGFILAGAWKNSHLI